MRTSVVLLTAIAVSCGSPSSTPSSATAPMVEAPAPAPAPTAPPGAADEAVDVVLSLHEWGLVDVDLSRGVAELSAGPGRPARPVIARKPVIYAHLVGRESASIDLRVRLPGGTLLEHWPPSPSAAPDLVSWHLDVRRGPCDATRGPIRDLPAAPPCAAPDGYCEVAELPRYVTTDHDCMDVGGESAPLLFYRAQVPLDALPLRFERGPDLRLRVTVPEGSSDRPRAIVRLSTGLVGPSSPRIAIARAQLPGSGTIEMPVGDADVDPIAERAALERALTGELGQTTDEARVFLDAWSEELFGPAGPAREATPTRRWTPVARAQDVVLYWLGPADVRRLSVLDASPHAISVARAFLVRVDLGAVATAGPAAAP